MVGGAAANVEAARAFAPALDARQQLERLEQVDLAADGREGLDLVDGDLHLGHLHLLFDAVFLFARHDRLAQFKAGLKFEVEFDVRGREVRLEALRGVAEVAHADLVGTGGQRQGVEAVDVGRHALGK